jgi:type III restriction enzyme
VAIKMATATGKTVVMAMLIAWQTINKAATPNDTRFAKRFLVVTPGITIKDRLRVLEPTDPGNYYDERDLVPADLKASLLQAQVVITNYHSFLLRDAKEIRARALASRSWLPGTSGGRSSLQTPSASPRAPEPTLPSSRICSWRRL